MSGNGDSDDETKKKVRGMLGDRAADLIDSDDEKDTTKKRS